MALHVARGVSEEAVHDETLRVDAVNQGIRRLRSRASSASPPTKPASWFLWKNVEQTLTMPVSAVKMTIS